MTAAIETLNHLSAAWAPWLWRVCWQAAIVIVVGWLLTQLLRRQSAWLRSWIWRLAYLKLLVLLVWASPVNLPLLPMRSVASVAVPAAIGRASSEIPNAESQIVRRRAIDG